MAYTLVPTELIVDGAITSAKLDTNLAISGTLGVTGEVTLATHLIMGDNDKIKIGTGGDLEIYHDGSNSYISNSTGNIYLGDTNGAVHIQAKLNEESIVAAADGAVSLYHDNAVKLATSSTGVTVTGNATFADNGKAIFGTGSDLQIYHDGSNSFIDDVTGSGTGDLFIKGSDAVRILTPALVVNNAANNENMITAVQDGAAILYHNGSPKIATTSTGITVTGNITGTLATAAQPNITSLGTLTSLTVDDITINGSTISDGGDLSVTSAGFTVDATGVIILDSDAGGIYFKDGGTTIGEFINASSDFMIKSAVQDKDILFKGNDGGSTITALTLDMSNAGDALFNNRIFTSGGTGANTSVNADDIVLGLTNNSTERGITIASTAGGGIRWNDGADAGTLQYVHSTNQMQFYTAGALATVIHGSGNINIGGSADTNRLTVSDATNISMSAGGAGQLRIEGNGYSGAIALDANAMHIYQNSSARDIVMGNNETEQFRLNVAGQILANGGAVSTPTFSFIGDTNTGMTRPTGDTLQFVTGGSARWRITSSGHFTPENQHARDIGGVNAEVRNIYAQGLFIGGSAAANKLDDYEEGTWTPATGPGSSQSYVFRSGNYTKVGRLVTAYFGLKHNGGSFTSGEATITGLPFAVQSTGAFQEPQFTIYTVGNCPTGITGAVGPSNSLIPGQVTFYLSSGESKGRGRKFTTNADTVLDANEIFDSDSFIKGVVIYYTA